MPPRTRPNKKFSRKVLPIIIMASLLISPMLLLNFSSAQTETTLEIKPIGIVYSNLSMSIKQQQSDYFNLTTPESLSFYAVESCIYRAGLKFEIIPEDNITDLSVLNRYSCLVFPQNNYISSSNRSDLLSLYQQYLLNGGNIIGFGNIAFYNETSNSTDNYQYLPDYDIFLKTLFNVKYDGFIASGSNTNFTLSTINHPIANDYNEGYELQNFEYPEVTGVDKFTINSTSINTNEFILVKNSTDQTNITHWGFATEMGNGRSVYMSGYSLGTTRWIVNSQILMRAVQWTVFRGYPSVGLQLTPGRLIWMLTIDQDWAFATENTTSALRKLIDLANDYQFTFGWAIIAEGPVDLNDTFYGFINWTACTPLFLEAYEKGHDLASHSVTHVYWDQVNITEQRALDELNLSKIYIEGNLSLPIYGLQVWGQGVWYARYNASKYIPASEYEYVTELYVYNFPYLMGREFYFGNTSDINYNIELPVLFRQSLSDHNYFVNLGLNASEAWIIEKQNFDNLYDIGHGMPYNFLWHDYSIDNDSRIPLLYNMLEYELWNRSDIYACSPYEFFYRMNAHDQMVYNVTYSTNRITISLNTQNVDSKYLNFITGQSFRIENTSQYIQSVSINNNSHYAFSDRNVILPKLTNSNYQIIIDLADQPSNTTRITHLTVGNLINTSVQNDLFSFNLSPLKQKVGRAFININEEPKAVFINGSLNSDWTFTDNQLSLNITVNGNTTVDIYSSMKISSLAQSDKYTYFPNENINLDYTITNDFKYDMSLNLTLTLKINNLSVKENYANLNVPSGNTLASCVIFTTNSDWVNGPITLEIEVNSNNIFLTDLIIENISQVYGFSSDLLLATVAVIAAFCAIFVVSNRYLASEKLDSGGRGFTHALFGLSPLIFNLGILLFGGYIYSQVLNPIDIQTISLFFVITLPLTFTLFGIDLLSRRRTRLALLSEDPSLIKGALNQSIILSTYISISIFFGLMIFTIFTGLITFELFLLILIFLIPNIFLMNLTGIYQSLEKKLIITGIYLIAALSGVILSFFLVYINGLLGLIIVQGVSIIIADLVLYSYLIRKILLKNNLPILDPYFADKLYYEKNKDIKLLVAGGLLVNLFLVSHYLIWFFIGVSYGGTTILFNSEIMLPLIIIQLTIFPSIGISGILVSNLKEKINSFSKLVLKKRKSAKEEISEIKKQWIRTTSVAGLVVAIIGVPLIYFMSDISQIFSISITLSIIELLIILISILLFSVLWIQFSILEIVDTKFSIIGLIIALIISIIIPSVIILLGILSTIMSIFMGFLLGQLVFIVISAIQINRKIKLF